LNELTFDINSWHAGSSNVMWVKFTSQGHMTRFKFTDEKINYFKAKRGGGKPVPETWRESRPK